MDLQDAAGMKSACEGIDYVLHQGALASVPRSVKDPLTSHESNINGTLNLLIAARDAKVRRIVYAASSSAYGDQPTQPKQEDMLPRPLSPYAVQKLTCEYYIQSFYRSYGLEGVCLRYFNIFGPRQAADSPYSGVIAQFTYKMMAGETPTIFGDGLTSRDFNFVDNAVSANLLACTAPSEVATGRVFNIGTGKSHTLNEVYAAIADQLASPPNPSTAPPAKATSSTPSPTSPAPPKSSATSPKPNSTRACRKPSPGTSKKKKRTNPPRFSADQVAKTQKRKAARNPWRLNTSKAEFHARHSRSPA